MFLNTIEHHNLLTQVLHYNSGSLYITYVYVTLWFFPIRRQQKNSIWYYCWNSFHTPFFSNLSYFHKLSYRYANRNSNVVNTIQHIIENVRALVRAAKGNLRARNNRPFSEVRNFCIIHVDCECKNEVLARSTFGILHFNFLCGITGTLVCVIRFSLMDVNRTKVDTRSLAHTHPFSTPRNEI